MASVINKTAALDIIETKFNNIYNLNFPFYMYPKAPFSGYLETEIYLPELTRFYTSLEKIKSEINTKTIFHLTLGAPMEEYYCMEPKNINLQWQQLYPYHLETIYKTTDFNILHFIISPTYSFSDSGYKEPIFLEKTSYMGWIKINNRIYVSKDGRYKVMIFCTPLPSDDKRNEKFIKNFISMGIEKFYDINKFMQSHSDNKFTKDLYKLMESVFDEIINKNGLVTCFSFAVFNNKSDLNNFGLFREIKSLFHKLDDEKTDKKILAEWLYADFCHSVKIFRSDIEKYSDELSDEIIKKLYISYVKPEYKSESVSYLQVSAGKLIIN